MHCLTRGLARVLALLGPLLLTNACDLSDDSGGAAASGACPAGTEACGAECVSFATNPYHCGACGLACGVGRSCNAGQCLCQPGRTDCGGACVDLLSDGANCGGCGLVCGAGTVCSAGQCGTSCQPGRTVCLQSCVDTLSDGINCGGCGVVCPAGQVCSSGTCACPPGQAPCGALCTNVLTDGANCGACGAVCQAGAVCQNGVCLGGSGGSSGSGGAGTGGSGGTTAGAGGTGGGQDSGGTTSGGASGGVGTGGTSSGGIGTGGSSSGGVGTGGFSTGGAGTGGDASGGSGGSSGTGGSGGGGTNLDPFSFFVTSLEAMRRLSGNQNGFGGDLRYGETNGLTGADKICTEIAEYSMPGASSKGWRAFLSASAGPDGQPVNAIDRIGSGPWYDRLGRLVSQDIDGLISDDRPAADSEIQDDLPNEYGEPNHNAGGNELDNHDVVTGSDEQGQLSGSTCSDWTSTESTGGGGGGGFGGGSGPQAGHSWPANSGQHWVSAHGVPGCAPSVVSGQGTFGGTGIGDSGGYGAIYCFALMP